MKNKIFVLIIVFSAVSCKIIKTEIPKKDWIFSFKAEACTACLANLDVTIKKDNSSWLRYEVLGDKYKNQAISVGKSYVKIIDEKSSYFKNSDLEGGKAITNGCLTFFESKTLDSVAKLEYKKYFKENKKLWGR